MRLTDGAATAPLPVARAPARVTLVLARRALWPEPAHALRLARALRQDAWRRLAPARGLAPLVVVRQTPCGAEATLAACFLDFGAAAPSTLDALDGIFQDAVSRRWRRWVRRSPEA
ncbi:MAG: hypothetical protein EA355_05680 [Rhodobacteraceae bacterium]|nr:MAG: hypothetical protein EA355_05680 [Paracoccaceae bacterium]